MLINDKCYVLCYNPPQAPVAQLDRVLVSEAKGRGFDSRRARQMPELLIKSHSNEWLFI